MRSYSNLHALAVATVTAAIVFGYVTLTGCSATVDPTLGYDIVPTHQKMVMRHLTFKGGKVISFDAVTSTDNQSNYTETAAPSGNFFETSLYRTDSLLSNNLGYGYIGVEHSDTFGMRTAAFASNIIYMNSIDEEEGFGYKPIFDTMKLILSIDDFCGDTLATVNYTVYELTKPILGSIISDKDTTSYINCDLEQAYDQSKPLFTFTFPDGEESGPNSGSVYLTPVDLSATGATWDFVRRLLLIPEDRTNWDGYGREDIEIYTDSVKWVERFNGICIVPDPASLAAGKRGGLFRTQLSASGLYMQGRNRNPQDPALIKDTVGMNYYFDDQMSSVGNNSANKITHDNSVTTAPFTDGLTVGNINMASVDAAGGTLSRDARTKVHLCYTDGVGGVFTELYFTDDFIDVLRSLPEESDEDGKGYSITGVNQCLIYFYLTQADYDWNKTQSNAALLTPLLDASVSRLGTYTNPNSLTAISDYNYVYEQTYSTSLNYDGNLNRSRACYMMNITGYMQSLLNYVTKKDENGEYVLKSENGTYAFKEEDSDYAPRTLYIGTEATNPYTFNRSILQGMEGGDNVAPIHVELTYTLFK